MIVCFLFWKIDKCQINKCYQLNRRHDRYNTLPRTVDAEPKALSFGCLGATEMRPVPDDLRSQDGSKSSSRSNMYFSPKLFNAL